MQQAFLDEYYSMAKTDDARHDIRTFQQQSGELLHESFARFKEMIRKCPHHKIELWELVKSFVDGLTREERKYLKSTSNGTLLNNHEQEDWDFLERMAKASKAEASAERRIKHPISKSLLDVDSTSKDRIAALEREIAKLKKKDVASVQFQVCEECGDLGHSSNECQANMTQTEEVNQVYGEKNYDMNSNTYHPGLRNHPNFRYGNASNQMNPNFQPSNQGGQSYNNRQQNNYQQGGYQRNSNNSSNNNFSNREEGYQRGYNNNYNNQGGNSGGQASNQTGNDDSLSSKMDAMMSLVKEIHKSNEVRDKSHEALSRQVGQLAEEMAQMRGSTGKLPSDTTMNPQHQSSSSKNTRNVHINAVSLLFNDKVVSNEITPPPQFVDGVVEDVDNGDDSEHEQEKNSQNDYNEKTLKNSFCENCSNDMVSKASVGVEVKSIPYPLALIDPNNASNFYKRDPPKDERWENFKQVKINLPLIDAIEKNPAHVECVKELSNENRHNKLPKHLVAHVHAVLSDALPPKLQDPGVPLISIQVGDFKFDRALLDLGACVSILPGSLFDQYDFGPLHKINTTVVLADQTPTHPRGMVKDVLVKVNDFYYPVDFLVVDYVASVKDTQPTIILGRPFLATTHAIINCANGSVSMKFGDRNLTLNVFPNFSNLLVENKCPKEDIVDRGDLLVKEEHPKEVCHVNDRFGTKKKKKKKKREKSPQEENERKLKMVDPMLENWEDSMEHRRVMSFEAEGGKHPTRPP